MESIGELTGGIAHDFNNLLGIIIGNLDLIKLRFEGNSKLKKQLNNAQNAALRGAAITRRLLNFSRQFEEKWSINLLNKPNRDRELAEAIRKTLDE